MSAITQKFYCLPSGQFFGSWMGVPGRDDNPFPGLGYIEVPSAPGDTQYFWDAEQQVFFLPPSATAEREWRDGELTEMMAMRDRHRDQLEIGGATTLSAEQFTELLTYMQALRDWPQSEAFPDSSARPVPPAFIEQVGGEQ
ncbi:phage tail assembly chaperone [Pseudomonas sichuanensis]|uniref:phage tail assembly chaperone n=1 Tax=Pseudomonas TaxID=286 RepID=UPI0036EE9621